MSNITITKSSPADYVDNPVADTRRENTAAATDYRPVTPPRDWQHTAVHYAGSGLLILVVTLLYLLTRLFLCGLPWLLWSEYSRTCEQWSVLESYAPHILVGGAAIFLVYRLFFCVQQAQVKIEQSKIENARFSLLPSRFGNPFDARSYEGMTPQEKFDNFFLLEQMASQLKAQTAPYEVYPSSLNTLSIGGNTSNMAAIEAPVEDGIVLTPDDTWRKWLLKAPHLLIGGKTDAGKTTFEQMLLGEYIENGDQVLILDPHWQPGKWYGLPATSGINAILSFLPDLNEELRLRLDEYRAGKLTEEFDRLTILIDEVPAIVSECIELTASGRPKLIDDRWPKFASKLGSEARKVGVRVILGSQSTLVTDLLINKQMRENYTRIGLGNLARVLLAGETDSKRQQALYDLLRGQSHPAAIEHRNEYYVLDTSNVVALAERSMRPLARLWTAESATRPMPQEDILAALLSQQSGRVAASVSGLSADLRASAKMPDFDKTPQTDRRQTADRPAWNAEKKLIVLRQLRAQGLTRSQARARMAVIGQGFDNDDWAKVGGKD